MLLFEVGDHNSVIPFFQEGVLELHSVEVGLVLCDQRIRIAKDRIDPILEPNRSDVDVLGYLHRRLMKKPAVVDDELHQTRRKKLVVPKRRHIFWCWPADVGPTGIVGNPLEGNRAGGKHDGREGLGRKDYFGEQKTAIG